MRIAAFNVENLFERARVLNQDQWLEDPDAASSRWSAGREVLESYSKLNALLRKAVYRAADKAAIVEHLRCLGLGRSDETEFVILRRNRGALLKRSRSGGIEVVADGREDWIGWLELKKEPVDEVATQNTARVLRDVNADVVVVVEAEHRISLCRFNEQVLEQVGGQPYDHIMLIDGNDERGIDVGLMTRSAAVIESVRSHVDDRGDKGPIFSRDCPEFHLRLPTGEQLIVLANHLKSKGYGSAAQSNARRRLQAARVREIDEQLRRTGAEHVVVAGDLNDTPGSAPLAPLLGDGSDLRDVSEHPSFQSDGRPGTYANGTRSDKIDYVLLSPALFAKVKSGGVHRRGVWGGKRGNLWPIYPEIKHPHQAASDHAAIWADVEF
ncbi:MAG TPA: endonuclease/exonuclease/phosphatase family protein [Microvirga sp.]|nr:endonuclease/exonuclease/phosphatase family protein [Microvirga sp.]